MTLTNPLKLAAFVLTATAVSFTAYAASVLDGADVVASPNTRFAVVQDDGELWSGGKSWSLASAQAAPTGEFADVAAALTPADLVRGYAWHAMTGSVSGIDWPIYTESKEWPLVGDVVQLRSGTFAYELFYASKNRPLPSSVAPNATFAIVQPDNTLWSNGALWVETSSRTTPLSATSGTKSAMSLVQEQILGNQARGVNDPWNAPTTPQFPIPPTNRK